VLERAGHRVLVATTGADALDLAAVERPGLILLDVVLPDIDGMTVLGRLKADPDLAAIPVLVLSMLPDDGTGRRLGAVGYLAKPVAEAVLLERVADVVRPDRDHLLVADDDPAVRRQVATLLRRKGYSVLEAADGEEAVAIALRERPAMVLLDIRMPRMDGIEALHALRDLEETHDVPVVMMTASPAVAGAAREEMAELGVSALLTKPVTMEDLLAPIVGAAAGQGR
jgi:CheY-like chemotaxis protein